MSLTITVPIYICEKRYNWRAVAKTTYDDNNEINEINNKSLIGRTKINKPIISKNHHPQYINAVKRNNIPKLYSEQMDIKKHGKHIITKYSHVIHQTYGNHINNNQNKKLYKYQNYHPKTKLNDKKTNNIQYKNNKKLIYSNNAQN